MFILIFYFKSNTMKLILHREVHIPQQRAKELTEIKDNREQIKQGKYKITQYNRNKAILSNIHTKKDIEIELDLRQWELLSSRGEYILIDNVLYKKLYSIKGDSSLKYKDDKLLEDKSNYYINSIITLKDSIISLSEDWKEYNKKDGYLSNYNISTNGSEIEVIYNLYKEVGKF